MSLRTDERGQAIQVGAVLLFAVLIVAFSSYQAVMVPADNRRVEFNHNQEVQSQLTDLRTALHATADSDSVRSVTVALGTTYPSRTLGLNPNPPAGGLRTVGTADPMVNLTVENATVDGETGDFWNGTGRSYNTGAIAYEPIYNRYDEAPTTIYDHSVLYNRFPSSNALVLANQTLVDGDRLSLLTVDGSLDRTSSRSTAVDVRPISSGDRGVLVEEANASSPITLTFTSRLSASRWERILSDQDNVVAVSGRPSPVDDDRSRIRVELATGVDYRLGMTKAAVGQGATEEGAAYLTDVAGDGATVQRGASHQLTLAVRDRFNNPVAGVSVDATVDGANAGSLDTTQKTTGTDGRVSFTYRTTGSTAEREHAINFTTGGASRLSGNTFDASTPENVTMEVTVSRSGGGGNGAYDVDWTDPSSESANDGTDLTDCGPESCTWNVGGSSVGSLELNASLTPSYEGIAVDFAVDNSSVGSLSPESTSTNTTGSAVTNLVPKANGTVDVLASGNDGSDVITLTLTNVQDSSGLEAMEGSGGTFWNGVAFDVRNPQDEQITITAVTVEGTTSGDAVAIVETNRGASFAGAHEVFVDASSGTDGFLEMDGTPYWYDSGTPLFFDSEESMGENARIDPGSTAEVSLSNFVDENGQAVDMSGETIAITLHYADGGEDTLQFEP